MAETQIPLLARLFAFAEVYDVLTHARTYAPIMKPAEALREIVAGSGTQFDPELTEKFAEFIESRNQV